MAKAESATKVVEWIASAVALGGGLLGWAGFIVAGRSKRREDTRVADREKKSDEQKLREDRDKYHEKWTDCEEEKVKQENDSQDRIRGLERIVDDATARLRAKSEELHDAQAYARLLNTYCHEALDELTHLGITFRPVPPSPPKPHEKEP